MPRRVWVEKERDRLFNRPRHAGGDGSRRAVPALQPGLRAHLGYCPKALVGSSLLDFIHPDDVADTIEQPGQPARLVFENCCRCADGSYRWLAWEHQLGARGKLMYAVAHDITGRKAAEEALHHEYAFRQSIEESLITGLRAIGDLTGRDHLREPGFLPHDRLVAGVNCWSAPAPLFTGRPTKSRPLQHNPEQTQRQRASTGRDASEEERRAPGHPFTCRR